MSEFWNRSQLKYCPKEDAVSIDMTQAVFIELRVILSRTDISIEDLCECMTMQIA